MNKSQNGVAYVALVLLALSVVLNVYLYQTRDELIVKVDTEEVEMEAKYSSRERKIRELNRVVNDSWEVFDSEWYGVKTLQNPMDVWITQEIMNEVKPDFIVEAGTLKGGSAILWASILMHINPDGRVITIDIEDQRTQEAINHPLSKERVEFILGGSTDPETVARVSERVEGKKVLVILDSLHTKGHVAAELKAYSPLVQQGSYIIVQDTGGFDHEASPGYPWGACLEFAEEHEAEWQIDRTRERFLVSANIDGFLRRIGGGPVLDDAVSTEAFNVSPEDDGSTTTL